MRHIFLAVLGTASATALAAYLIGAFIGASWNIALWDFRIGLTLLWLLVAIPTSIGVAVYVDDQRTEWYFQYSREFDQWLRQRGKAE